MRRHKNKIQRIINEIKCTLTDNGISLNSVISLKLQLMADCLNDYFSAKEIIKERGEIVEFNKGTSYGANPMFKIKNDALKHVIKLLKELFENEGEIDDTENFINSLVNV